MAFFRYTGDQRVLVISHFERHHTINLTIVLTAAKINSLQLKIKGYLDMNLLTGAEHTLIVAADLAVMSLSLAPMQSMVFQL